MWRARKVSCAYCTNPGVTVDHVVPLSRGGTNYEGNLVPCCKICNSSKCDLLITEWRHGKGHGRTVSPSPWITVEAAAPRARREPKLKRSGVCRICLGTFIGGNAKRLTCSPDCSYEYAKRSTRESYRAKVGLEPTWDSPTGEAWIRKHAKRNR
jgi:hypothetical protein